MPKAMTRLSEELLEELLLKTAAHVFTYEGFESGRQRS